jgi:hypothetical protein
MSEACSDDSARNKQTVFVVMHSEAYEGGNIEGIFRNVVAARSFAIALLSANSRPNREWIEKYPNVWERGCDRIDIVEHPVEN